LSEIPRQPLLLLVVQKIQLRLLHTSTSLDSCTATTSGINEIEMWFYSARTTIPASIAMTKFGLKLEQKQQNLEVRDLQIHKLYTATAPRTSC
jgi:hypothetical protein